MKPSKEQMEEYKAMAKASPDSMEKKIRAHLEANCPKFAGHEDKLDDCLKYLTDCARKILGGKNGEVNNETCYRICRDYFNDEIWKAEEEEKAKLAAEAAEAKKKEADRTAAKEKKAVIKSTPTCRVCGREVINVYKDGMCVECYDKRPMQAEKTAQIQPVPDQLDLFAAMGCR